MSNHTPRGKLVRRWLWRLIGLVLSMSLAVYLFRQIDADQFATMVRSANLSGIALAFVIYLMLNFFRAVRFSLLLDQPLASLRRLFPIAMYHNFWVRVLPLKMGELTFIVLTQRYLKQSVISGISSLAIARLFDLFMVLSGAEVGLLFTPSHFPAQTTLTILLLPALAIYLAALYFSGTLVRALLGITRGFKGSLERIQVWLSAKFGALAADLDRQRRPRFFLATLALTFCTYITSLSFNLVLLSALGIAFSPALILSATIVILLDSLPLTTISGLGVIEGGWTVGFVTFAGLSTGQAVAIGFFLHACQIAAAALTGIISYLLLQIPERNSVATS